MSNPNPPHPSSAPWRPRHAWIGFLMLALFASFLAQRTVVVAGGSDSSGYLNSARLLAEGRLTMELRVPGEFGPKSAVDPMHFLPQGFFPRREQRTQLTPTYPTGLPLQFAFAASVLGWTTGPLLVLLASALAAVWLCYLVGRELALPVPLALAGAVLLATFPVFLFTSIQPLSDTPATAWTLAALYAALRARRHGGWAAAAGAAFAMAVLVRPTNLLLAPALVVALGWNFRRLLLFVAGGLPGAVWLAFYNHALYGHPLRSGYGEIFGAFGWQHGAPTAVHFARWLALLLPAVILLLPFCALIRPEFRRAPLAALALGFAAITGCYLYYEVSHEVWWCLRFILPVVPLLILAALLGVEAIARAWAPRWPRGFREAAALLLGVWAFGNSWYWNRELAVFLIKDYEQAYADGAALARERLPQNALVVSLAFSGTLHFYGDTPVLRWDQFGPEQFARYVERARQAGRPICAVLFASEEAEAFRNCPGTWTKLGQARNAGLWQLTASAGAKAAPP